MTAARRRDPRESLTALLGGCVAVLALVVGTLSGSLSASASNSVSALVQADSSAAAGIVQAADLSKFQPGNIISNAVFFNKSTMTEAQVQGFLQAKVPSCQSGYTCLKDWYDTSRTTAADAMCGAYSGGVRERASRIIYKVAQACGINPQVLLTTLQKEQGLVTHTWPSDWRFRIAMGQGCPDTAACDTRYYGFFNQVYGAAWQMKRYANPAGTSQYFTWYAPGKTWNILYNPNRNCGSSPVYVQNQATANLYYYTPYQPNAAALRSGYGEGDGCSAYGNRNFYNYFTDWFGSTQNVAQALVKVGAEVSIISGDRRYGILAEAYPEYRRVFGAPAVVDEAYLAMFTNAGVANVYVRNASNGEVALLQDGQTHPFTTCGLVAAWGGACGETLVQLASREYNAFVRGALVTAFARTESGGRIHQIIESTLQPYYDAAAAAAANGGVIPYAAVMRSSVSGGYQIRQRQLFAPGRMILAEGDPTVWLPMNDGRLIGLPAWSLAAEMGLPTTVASRVTPVDLAGYTRSDALSQYVSCAGTAYFGASGGLHALPAGTPAGFTTSMLDAGTCGRLALTRPSFATVPFVKTATNGTVYRADDGVYRPIPSTAKMIELNGGIRPTVATISQATLDRYILGPIYLTSGTLVKVDGQPSVWFVDGDRILGLPSWGLARAWGLPSPARTVSPASLEGLPIAGVLTHFAACGGSLYAAGNDILSRVGSGDPAGNVVTSLSAGTCATLRLSGSPITGPVFVTDGSRVAVATSGGFLRLADQASILRANRGTTPAPARLTAAYFAALPAPTQLPMPGDLVRASDSTSVTLVDGAIRRGIANWGIAADLGVQPRYRIVPPAAVANLPVTGSVGVFVRCGGVDYAAAQGILSPVTTTGLGGIRTVQLDAATCATLVTMGAAIAGRIFIQANGSPQVYVTQGGGLHALTATESPASLNGGTPPRILTLDARTIAGIPAT